LGACKTRALAETMPVVTVPSSPNGLPIATTRWPMNTSDASANRNGSPSPSACGSAFSTARSVDGSWPTTSTGASSFSPSRSATSVPPEITCWFVTRCPFASNSHAVPVPAPSAPLDCTK
jgi:hypothetical protein